MDNFIQIENIKTSKELGQALKRLRKARGMSQSELARIAKIAQPTVSTVESGQGTIETMLKLIQALRLNLALAAGPMIKKRPRASALLAKINK